MTRNGVKFKSYIHGREYYLTPEKGLKIQLDLGVDIAVCLDQCAALPASREKLARAVDLTAHWAKKTRKYYKNFISLRTSRRPTPQKMPDVLPPLLFAVIQGGLDKKLRLKSLAELKEIGFDGYNIGGLSVGETPAQMLEVLGYLTPKIPADKPRYLMGVGYPENIVEAVKRGVDMFDCVIPTREGRHGRLFFPHPSPPAPLPLLRRRGRGELKKEDFYKTININRAKFARDFKPINKNSKLPELRNYSLAYLHYLFKINEPLGQRLASLNNLEFYLDLMAKIRYSIRSGTL